jgi:hypothetical protein
MIQLPVGFDYATYFNDYAEVAAPFAVIALIFAAYRHIKRSGSLI